MIIRKLEEINEGSDRFVNSENWFSRRLLLKKDGMGFSLHDTVIRAGTETQMWYQNHLEAVYCIDGEGEIEETLTGKKYEISAGTVYALDRNDKHILRARSQLRMVCVFNPPVTGQEVHDESGAYPLVKE